METAHFAIKEFLTKRVALKTLETSNEAYAYAHEFNAGKGKEKLYKNSGDVDTRTGHDKVDYTHGSLLSMLSNATHLGHLDQNHALYFAQKTPPL